MRLLRRNVHATADRQNWQVLQQLLPRPCLAGGAIMKMKALAFGLGCAIFGGAAAMIVFEMTK